MNPIYDKFGKRISFSLMLEILFQIPFICYYIYKIIINQNDVMLYTVYIIFTCILSAYVLYCIYSLIIKKYPNHFFWIVTRVATYLLKIAAIYFDLRNAFIGNETFIYILQKNILTFVSIIIIFAQATFDLSKASRYSYFENSEAEENRVGIVILYFILNPIMFAYFIYNFANILQKYEELAVINLCMASAFVINLFMVLSKITINNLLILISAVISIVNSGYYTYLGALGEFIPFFGEKWTNLEIAVNYAFSIILFLIAAINHRCRMKLVYKKGEYSSNVSLFISRKGIFFTNSTDSKAHKAAWRESKDIQNETTFQIDEEEIQSKKKARYGIRKIDKEKRKRRFYDE